MGFEILHGQHAGARYCEKSRATMKQLISYFDSLS